MQMPSLENTTNGSGVLQGIESFENGTLANSTLPHIHLTQPILIVTSILTLLVVTAAVGNGLLCFVVLQSSRLRHESDLFIASLAMADLLMCVVVFPFSVFNLLHEDWKFGEVLCQIWVFLDTALCAVSIYTMVAIAMNICYHVKMSFMSLQKLLLDYNRLYIAGIWLFAILLAAVFVVVSLDRVKLGMMPHMHGIIAHGLKDDTMCFFDEPVPVAIASVCLTFLIPLVYCVVIYIQVLTRMMEYIKLQKPLSRYNIHLSGSSSHIPAEGLFTVTDRRTGVILLGIKLLVFFVAWAPFFVAKIISTACHSCISGVTHAVVVFLPYVNSWISPLVYGMLNARVHARLKQLCWFLSQRSRTARNISKSVHRKSSLLPRDSTAISGLRLSKVGNIPPTPANSFDWDHLSSKSNPDMFPPPTLPLSQANFDSQDVYVPFSAAFVEVHGTCVDSGLIGNLAASEVVGLSHLANETVDLPEHDRCLSTIDLHKTAQASSTASESSESDRTQSASAPSDFVRHDTSHSVVADFSPPCVFTMDPLRRHASAPPHGDGANRCQFRRTNQSMPVRVSNDGNDTAPTGFSGVSHRLFPSRRSTLTQTRSRNTSPGVNDPLPASVRPRPVPRLPRRMMHMAFTQTGSDVSDDTQTPAPTSSTSRGRRRTRVKPLRGVHKKYAKSRFLARKIIMRSRIQRESVSKTELESPSTVSPPLHSLSVASVDETVASTYLQPRIDLTHKEQALALTYAETKVAAAHAADVARSPMSEDETSVYFDAPEYGSHTDNLRIQTTGLDADIIPCAQFDDTGHNSRPKSSFRSAAFTCHSKSSMLPAGSASKSQSSVNSSACDSFTTVQSQVRNCNSKPCVHSVKKKLYSYDSDGSADSHQTYTIATEVSNPESSSCNSDSTGMFVEVGSQIGSPIERFFSDNEAQQRENQRILAGSGDTAVAGTDVPEGGTEYFTTDALTTCSSENLNEITSNKNKKEKSEESTSAYSSSTDSEEDATPTSVEIGVTSPPALVGAFVREALQLRSCSGNIGRLSTRLLRTANCGSNSGSSPSLRRKLQNTPWSSAVAASDSSGFFSCPMGVLASVLMKSKRNLVMNSPDLTQKLQPGKVASASFVHNRQTDRPTSAKLLQSRQPTRLISDEILLKGQPNKVTYSASVPSEAVQYSDAGLQFTDNQSSPLFSVLYSDFSRCQSDRGIKRASSTTGGRHPTKGSQSNPSSTSDQGQYSLKRPQSSLKLENSVTFQVENMGSDNSCKPENLKANATVLKRMREKLFDTESFEGYQTETEICERLDSNILSVNANRLNDVYRQELKEKGSATHTTLNNFERQNNRSAKSGERQTASKSDTLTKLVSKTIVQNTSEIRKFESVCCLRGPSLLTTGNVTSPDARRDGLIKQDDKTVRSQTQFHAHSRDQSSVSGDSENERRSSLSDCANKHSSTFQGLPEKRESNKLSAGATKPNDSDSENPEQTNRLHAHEKIHNRQNKYSSSAINEHKQPVNLLDSLGKCVSRPKVHDNGPETKSSPYPGCEKKQGLEHLELSILRGHDNSTESLPGNSFDGAHRYFTKLKSRKETSKAETLVKFTIGSKDVDKQSKRDSGSERDRSSSNIKRHADKPTSGGILQKHKAKTNASAKLTEVECKHKDRQSKAGTVLKPKKPPTVTKADETEACTNQRKRAQKCQASSSEKPENMRPARSVKRGTSAIPVPAGRRRSLLRRAQVRSRSSTPETSFRMTSTAIGLFATPRPAKK